MATTEIWQHRTSGEWYLVRVDGDGSAAGGEVIEACGPLPRDEAEYTVNEGAGWFNGDAETAEDIIADANAYRVVYPYQSA